MDDSSGQPLVNADPTVNTSVKLHCSYGGRIRRRRENPDQLCYAGGVTRIVTVERDAKFGDMFAKLSSEFDSTGEFAVKYKHPGYDFDTLILVEDDDDVENMIWEYNEFLSGDQRRRVRVFLFARRIEPGKSLSPNSSDSATNPEFVFGSDEEIGSDSGSSFIPVQQKEDQTVVEPKSGGSDQPPPKSGGSDQPPPKSGGSDQLSTKSGGSDQSSTKSGGSDQAPAKCSGSDEPPAECGGSDQPLAKSGGSDEPTTKRGGSDQPPTPVEPALDLLQIPGMIVPGLSGSSCGSNDSVNDTDNAIIGKKVEPENPREGGACVSGPVKAASGGQTSSGSSADNDSDDNGKNLEPKIPREGHVTGGACVPVAASGELQSECEGEVRGGACVYGVPVTTMIDCQTFYAVPRGVVEWDRPVYSFVPATVAVVRANGQVAEENQEANDDQEDA